MFDLGPHAGFIWLSYGITITVLIALIGWVISDGRRQRHELARLESQGVGRRGSARMKNDEKN